MSVNLKRALLCVIIDELCNDDIQEPTQIKRRKVWSKSWYLNRPELSHSNLLKELEISAPSDFKNFLRMDSETYNELLRKVSPFIKKQDTIMCDAISPNERLSATLRFLASGQTFEDLKFLTAISPQSLGVLIMETCSAIIKVLKPYIKLPATEDEWKAVATEFGDRWNFPNCIGALDGKHVQIKKPNCSGSYYFNYKKTVLLARHVCMQHKTIQVPVKTTEVYTRPTWRHVSEPCHINQICTTLKMFQEPAYRDIIRHQTTKQIVYDCCPGWEQASKSSVGCTKPVCKTKCSNGGRCVKPDFCSCPKGFAGKYCELDINECKEHKPCDQLCYNTEGSYYCKCREGFMLHTDGQSCKKLDGDMNGIEAKDLENEVDNEALIYRLHKVEKMIASDKVAANELHKTVEEATNMIDSLKTRVNNLERKNYEINAIQDKLRNYEAQSRKLENLVSILFKCRSSPNGFCP
ncbi:unnamed protein product [Hermetia illucens]|uniref:Uncharacterized protein n=1 Tax=Hermetia illucens TaxID=343691 RepID=A0A7R8ULF8_HERIL|nr:unnamed protein product [Hermetia illucens]